MIRKKESQLKLICIVIFVILFHASHVHLLRSPYYMNGKYAATDVDTAQWSKIKTITNVSIMKINLIFVATLVTEIMINDATTITI